MDDYCFTQYNNFQGAYISNGAELLPQGICSLFSGNLCRSSNEIFFLRSLFNDSPSVLSFFSIFEIVDILTVNTECFLDVVGRLH